MLSGKILLTIASVAAVSAAAIGGTYASFTATPTTIASNAFTAGTLVMQRSGSGAIFSATAMKIGDEQTGSVRIDNTGTLAAAYTLTGSTSGDATMAHALQLKIYADTDSTGTVVYNGALDGFSSALLGTFAATSGSHTYYFHMTLPTTGADATDNALQGKQASASFQWSAVQA